MALQGTIDDFPLTDVLSLLSSSSRSGRLRLDGDRGTATLLIDTGQVVGGGPAPVPSGATGLVVELLRHREGQFAFEATEPVPEGDEAPVDPQPVGECLGAAGEVLERWREIEAVVPSPAHTVLLSPELPGEVVELRADEWRSVVAVAGGRSVGELGELLGTDEFTTAERVAGMVNAGLVEVCEPQMTWSASATDDLAPPAAEGRIEEDATVEWHAEATERDDASVGWLLAEDDASAPAAAVTGSEAPPPAAPEHFPIDDLLGGPEVDADDPWSSPEMEQLEQQRATPVDEAVEFEPIPLDQTPFEETPAATSGPEDPFAGAEWPDAAPEEDSADEVLRQMSKLSPEAAEAIAAALNSPASPTVVSADDPGDDGPATYSGTL